jgi:hypothetical protein
VLLSNKARRQEAPDQPFELLALLQRPRTTLHRALALGIGGCAGWKFVVLNSFQHLSFAGKLQVLTGSMSGRQQLDNSCVDSKTSSAFQNPPTERIHRGGLSPIFSIPLDDEISESGTLEREMGIQATPSPIYRSVNGFDLQNNCAIKILTSDFRVRDPTYKPSPTF